MQTVRVGNGGRQKEREQQARYHVLAQQNSGRAAVGDIFASTDVKKFAQV